jgi:hypothetical protein
MMPGMIQQAMAGGQTPPGAPAMAAGSAPAASAAAAAGAAAGGRLDFGDLAPHGADPKQMVRSVVQAAGWQLQETADVWSVTVPVGALRKQIIHVDFTARDQEGHAAIAFSSICGPASERNAMALLRYNTKMVHGAFAVQQTPSGEMIVIQANELVESADPLDITRMMTAVAWQADKVEQKLGTGDNY